jgi:hypothetical protein
MDMGHGPHLAKIEESFASDLASCFRLHIGRKVRTGAGQRETGATVG